MILLAFLLSNAWSAPVNNEYHEKDGQVVMEAEQYSSMTGNWKAVEDQGRVVMRMNGPGWADV